MKTPVYRQAVWLILLILLAALLAACTPANNTSSSGDTSGPILETSGQEAGSTEAQGNAPAEQPPVAETPVPAAETPLPAAETEPAEPSMTSAQQVEEPLQSVTEIPDPENFEWVPLVSGLRRPLDLAELPDGSGRLVVLEQPGTIQVIENGGLQGEPFLDIQDRVGSQGNEQGLLGIAFHPNYAENGYFYLNYTDRQGNTVIARYQAAVGEPPARADSASEKVLLAVDQPYRNHNGGQLAFGPDGYLYIGLGDGGSGGDPHGNAQSLDTLLGKLLRIDVDGGDPYGIPADNPFVNGGGRPEIWVYGLRNPWRFSFDRGTGDLYIADVGQSQWEEINFLPAGSPGGANFGWNYLEGSHPYQGNPPADVQLINPVFEYDHGFGCSVTGGFVYRGQNLPEFHGVYIFADYCSGLFWGLLRGPDGFWQSEELFSLGLNVSSFGEDAAGEIYMVEQSNGAVYRLQRK